jgi:hypothetical protein
MPPGQVSRGQGGTGLRFLTRSLSLWRKRDKTHVSDNSDTASKSKENDDSDNGKSDGSKSASSSNSSAGGSSGTSSATDQGKSSFPAGPPPPPPCVLSCIPDNDPRVVYSASWLLSPHGFFQTSHQTDVVGSSLSFKFNGTGITVFGSIPASNATHAPPTAAYSIDAAAPVVTAEPLAAGPIPNQPLFSASGLSNGLHTLNVTVTAVDSASPFAVDYFIVKPAATSLPPSPSAASSPLSPSASVILPVKATNDAPTKSSSGMMAGILAGVLGAVIFVLLCVVAVFIVILRRRRRRALRAKDLQSSLFTSPESILRYSREPSSHYPATSSSWLDKTRSVVGKSWITNFEVKSVSGKS